MKYLPPLVWALTTVQAIPVKRSGPRGIDISAYQTHIDWVSLKAKGVEFVYIKATEGIGYISPEFKVQWENATKAGIIHGAFHVARPNESNGAAQAAFFLENGGRWTPDGETLPGALDLEYDPYGGECYGLTASQMVSWIKGFSDTYERGTGRLPGNPYLNSNTSWLVNTDVVVIYTTTAWWTTCAGNNSDFGKNPLWIARYASSPEPLPAGWTVYSFWQYATKGPNPGEADVWNGSYANLKRFALGQ